MLYFCTERDKTGMNKLSGLVSAVVLMMLVSCAEQYSVVGNSSESILDGRMAYIKTIDNNTYQTLDSCEVLHGNFHMAGPLDSVRFVTLFLGDDSFIPFVLEEGDVLISIQNSQIRIGGTPLNDRLFVFFTSRDSLAMLRAELPKRESQMYLEGYSQDEILDVLSTEQMKLNQSLDKLETKFITDNFDNVLGVTWFLELCNRAYNMFGYATTTPQIDEIYGQAPESFRQQPAIKAFMDEAK